MAVNILALIVPWQDACIAIRMEIQANLAKPLFLIMDTMVVAMGVASMIIHAGLDPIKEPQCLVILATIDPSHPHLAWPFNLPTWMRK